MSFNVMVKDEQGTRLQCGSLKSAISQAKRILGCKKDVMHYITIACEEGGFDTYLFDSRMADKDYWLEAIRPTTKILSSGAVPQ
jgi:hypothetical protein